jgi:pimeloyl-ACP methyl ester carboxylesterase
MATQAERDARMDRYYAAPQTLVKVGRRRLNLLIRGEGEPTVIFAPGSGASTVEWMAVQSRIARTTRTVAYDNAGFGFSDPGPLPRTASATVNDLRAALQAADLAPPYVLAGWSWGGLIMRLFAFSYPRDVVGMVMVDSSSEHQMRRLINDPKVTAWQRRYRREVFARAEQLARAGGLVAGTPEFEALVGKPHPALTPAVAAALVAQWTAPGRYRALRSESASMPATLREMDAARRPLGDMPLIVFTAGKSFPLPPETLEPPEAWRGYWHAGHDEIAALSTRGERRTVDTGHSIQVEQPEAVIAAIEEVLALARDS